MQLHTGRRNSIVAMLGAVGLIAGSGVALAADMGTFALPGTDDSATQFAVGTDIATVEVNPAGPGATVMNGTFENTSNGTLTCSGPADPADPAGTVTHEDLVDRSLAYLTNNTVPPPLGLPIDTGSLDVMLGSGSLGSLGLGDPAVVELDQIQQAQEEARIDGHYGTVDPFTVDKGDTHDWSTTLTVPSDGGEQTNFDAAALFTCEQDGQWYAVAGYEMDDDEASGGGSLSMGSLGS